MIGRRPGAGRQRVATEAGPGPEKGRLRLDVVVPILNEAGLLPRLIEQLVGVLEGLACHWRVVLVDDGSTDGSLQAMLAIQAREPRIVVVELSRNWGHQAAVTAGLAQSDADAVVLMDGDLQDPPGVIEELVAAWRAGAQVVVAQRRSRAELGLRRILFRLFYRLLAWLSDFPIPINAGIFSLLDRQAVAAINGMAETNRYLPGLRAFVGFRTEVVLYDRAARAGGEPKQSFWRLLRYGLDAIFSFSYKPLRLSLLAGSLVACFAMVYGVALVVCRLMGVGIFGNPVVLGYTSTIVSVLFLGGVQLISVGILGEYIGRIYDEVKRRPLFVITRLHDASAASNAQAQAISDSGLAGSSRGDREAR
jgi:polyisoprenyl-phosphate glycosyltransferase